MTRRLGVGVVGAGFNGRFHIRSWTGVRDADIVGVVDRTEARAGEAAALARRLRVGEARVFRTVAELVADPEVDAVWICAPNFTRVAIMQEIAILSDGQVHVGPRHAILNPQDLERTFGIPISVFEEPRGALCVRIHEKEGRP